MFGESDLIIREERAHPQVPGVDCFSHRMRKNYSSSSFSTFSDPTGKGNSLFVGQRKFSVDDMEVFTK
jgi:hypothetical protein